MKTNSSKIHFYFNSDGVPVFSFHPHPNQIKIINTFKALFENLNFKNISWYIDDNYYFNCYRISGYKQFTHVLIITKHYD